MFRLSKSTVLVLALCVGLAGLGETLKGKSGDAGNPLSGASVPVIEAILDEATESLTVTGYGAPFTAFSFRFYYSINGGTWQYLGPISGSFGSQGEARLDIPLGIFGAHQRIDALMDMSVWDNSGTSSGFLTSMPWGMTMQEYECAKLQGDITELWAQWQIPLPGTVSPTFTVSRGALPASSGQSSAPPSALVFFAGPAPILQAMYSTGIEGMLPVN